MTVPDPAYSGQMGDSLLDRVTRLPFVIPGDPTGVPASVLLALAPVEGADDLELVLVRRPDHLRQHAGQVGLPGGAVEPGDADGVAAALREAQEEVGLDPASAEVLALLPDLYIPVSSFVVTPVLAWWRRPHPVSPRQPAEVAHVTRLPISELVDPANRIRVRHPSGWVGPAFQVRGLLVWGFTAGVISTLLDMGGWARRWEPGRIIELPDASAPVPAARGGAPDEVLP